MTNQSLRIIPIMLLVLVSLTYHHSVVADDHSEIENEENDLGEELGTVAIIFLVIGSSYVVLKRLYAWSSSWSEERKELRTKMINIYRKSRKPLLILHNWTLILATIIGGIHGILLINQEFSEVITGIIAWIIMILLSIFGLIIYYRLRPVWDNRETRGFVRFIHRQWILSVGLIILLIIHAG